MSNQTLIKPVSPLYRFAMCRVDVNDSKAWYAHLRRHLWILEHQSGRLPAWSEVAFLYDVKNKVLFVGIPVLGAPYQLTSSMVFDVQYRPETEFKVAKLDFVDISHIPSDHALCLKKNDELFSEKDEAWDFVGLAAKDVALVNS